MYYQHKLAYALILCALLTACGQGEVQSTPATISVSGTGLIEAEPDKAVLSISASALNHNVAIAKQQADKQYQAILTVLQQAGIAKQHIKVTQLSIQTENEWVDRRQVYQGERVTRHLKIEVHKLDTLSQIIQQLVTVGVSSIDNMQTGFIDEKKITQQAMALAAKDAQHKARFLAKQFNRDLGAAIEINAMQNHTPLRQPFELARSSAKLAMDAPVEQLGTLSVSATLNARFTLN